ncbi:TPA: helicase-related protein, partial [Klebsiella pneumoniae]
QRRLASSPEAIYQSLKRRRNRLKDKLDEMKLMARGQKAKRSGEAETLEKYKVSKSIVLPDDWDELDEDLSAEEYELYSEEVADQATAAETIFELEAEINSLRELENQALVLVQSGNDKKWEELSRLLQDSPEMINRDGERRKLIIFTEHKDTLNYLRQRVSDLLGQPQAVRVIYGGTNRDERRKIQTEFRSDPTVLILIATDAAGEGVNLQNANLMVNYDLPWNPNRLEQRFGRIHRIGQKEVCHLWNIVANETREGAVFQKLFEKLEIEKSALGGKVFDILGEAFDNVSLKDLLIEAIRYGEDPATRAKMDQVIEGALDSEHLKEILRRNALVESHMGLEGLYAIKEQMEKAEARRLQPFFIRAFFQESFKALGGELRPREQGRYEINHVPALIRERDRSIGESRTPVLSRYERICFEKQQIRPTGKALAELIHPVHPLMHSVLDLTLQMHRNKLKQGAILIDPADDSDMPRLILMLEHTIRETNGQAKSIASRRIQFVSIDMNNKATYAGWAPHLDLLPIEESDLLLIKDILHSPWLSQPLEPLALQLASEKLVPDHYAEVKLRRELQADKTLEAVHERLVKEINYWQDRFLKLSDDVKAGKQPKLQPENARRRVDELTARLQQRTAELIALKQVVSSTPVVIGSALVIPQGFLSKRKGEVIFTPDAASRAHIEKVAMSAVTSAELTLGHSVFDVSADKCGWDITARPPLNTDGSLPQDRHIEVKGRSKGQTTITVSRNEILYALNQAEKFLLAIVLVDGDSFEGPFYIRQPFNKEPDTGVASINYDLAELLSKATEAKESV